MGCDNLRKAPLCSNVSLGSTPLQPVLNYIDLIFSTYVGIRRLPSGICDTVTIAEGVKQADEVSDSSGQTMTSAGYGSLTHPAHYH